MYVLQYLLTLSSKLVLCVCARRNVHVTLPALKSKPNKMVVHHNVEGYEQFLEFIANFNSNGQPVIILFGGSDAENGLSWCDDCVRADPVISAALSKYAQPNTHFIHVKVGDKPFWKDLNCPFRKNSKTRLMILPTILKWGTQQRLEGDQCEKIELLELLLTED